MNCFYHSDKDGQYKCHECGKSICEECAHTDGYKAVCKDCYQLLSVKGINRNYSRFWGFILSLIPGAGHMYLGFMEQGLLIMLVFCGIISLMSSFFGGPILAFALVMVWFYSFFDAYHIKKKINNNEIILNKSLFSFKLKTSYYAYGFIVLGGIILVNEFMDNFLRDILTWSQITRIRNMLLPMLLIIVGILILLRIKKSETVNKIEEEI